MERKDATLAELRARIRRMEGGRADPEGIVPLGVAEIDAALPDGGLRGGAIHAVTGEDIGPPTAFAAALLARTAAREGRPALWIARGRDLHAAGLAAYGLTPDRLIAARVRSRTDLLWAMEEALRCRGLSAVLGETRGTEDIDLTTGRRLQLAAEAGGVLGVLLLDGRRATATAVTRWRVTAHPGAPRPGEPGVAAERWKLALERCRGGGNGCWTVEWREGAMIAVADEANHVRLEIIDKMDGTAHSALEGSSSLG